MDIDKIMALVNKGREVLDTVDGGIEWAYRLDEAIESPESFKRHMSQSEALKRRQAVEAGVEYVQGARRAEYRAGDFVKEALELQAQKGRELRDSSRVLRSNMSSIPMIKGGKVIGTSVEGSQAYRLAPAAYSSISDRVSGKRRLIDALDAAGLGMIDSTKSVSKQHLKAARSIDAVDALKGTPLNLARRGKNLSKAVLAHEWLGSPLYRAISNRANAKRFEALVKSGAKGIKDPGMKEAVRALDRSISPIRAIGPGHGVSMTPRSPNTVYNPRTPQSKIPGSSGGFGLKAKGGKFLKTALKSAPIIGAVDDLGRVAQDIQEGDWRGVISHSADALLDTVGIGAIVNLGFGLEGEHSGFFDWAIGEDTESEGGLGKAWDTVTGWFD